MTRKLILIGLLLALVALPASAQLTATTVATGTTDVQVVTAFGAGESTQLYFCGFSSRETGGAASSTVDVYAGTDATGRLLFTFSLTASESRSEGPWGGAECLPAPEGIWIDRGGTGSTKLSVYSMIR